MKFYFIRNDPQDWWHSAIYTRIDKQELIRWMNSKNIKYIK